MEKEINPSEVDIPEAKPVPLSPPSNWKTPTHPPYAEMIQAAIRTMAEDGGSTAPAIDMYIKANYDSLPWGHQNLFPYYFQKLLAVGEIQETGHGRFIISPTDPIDGNGVSIFPGP